MRPKHAGRERYPGRGSRIAQAQSGLFQLHRLEVGGDDDLQQLAVIGIVEHPVLDARRLQPGRALAQGDHVARL